MQSKEQIAKELNYLMGIDEFEASKILQRYNIARFDAIAITRLVFDLSKQLSEMVLAEINN